MSDEQKAQEELVTIAGGVELEVTLGTGEKETVKVRQIPITKWQSFVMALANEAEAIELYCDKPKGWADTLTLASANAVLNKGQELNLPFYEDWFRRQSIWRDSQQQGAIAELEKKVEELVTKSASASSVPQSPTTTN